MSAHAQRLPSQIATCAWPLPCGPVELDIASRIPPPAFNIEDARVVALALQRAIGPRLTPSKSTAGG